MIMTLLPGKKEEKRADLDVYGSVQGVFFRRSAKLKAEALGLRGFAENTTDGSVHVALEGYEDAINQFINWVKSHPAPAEIVSVDVEWDKEFKNFRNFETR